MKKLVFLLFILVSLGFTRQAFAQVEIGLHFGPALSVNRVSGGTDSLQLNSNGVGGRVSLGVNADFIITDNYHFSTGLWFATKRAGLEARSRPLSTVVKESYNLQYLQIPLSLKLYTSEVALDKRIYVQLGLLNEVLVFNEPSQDNHVLIENFRPVDFSVLLGTGLEYRIGLNTLVYGGISYQRGLVNAVQDPTEALPDLVLKNDLLVLQLAIKF